MKKPPKLEMKFQKDKLKNNTMKINTLIITLAIGLQSMVGFSQDYYLHCGSILDVQTGKEIKKIGR